MMSHALTAHMAKWWGLTLSFQSFCFLDFLLHLQISSSMGSVLSRHLAFALMDRLDVIAIRLSVRACIICGLVGFCMGVRVRQRGTGCDCSIWNLENLDLNQRELQRAMMASLPSLVFLGMKGVKAKWDWVKMPSLWKSSFVNEFVVMEKWRKKFYLVKKKLAGILHISLRQGCDLCSNKCTVTVKDIREASS